jgi:hypothetical protein
VAFDAESALIFSSSDMALPHWLPSSTSASASEAPEIYLDESRATLHYTLRASPIQAGQMGPASQISRPSCELPAIAFPVQRPGSQRRLQTCNPKLATSTSGWPRWRLAEDPSLRPRSREFSPTLLRRRERSDSPASECEDGAMAGRPCRCYSTGSR